MDERTSRRGFLAAAGAAAGGTAAAACAPAVAPPAGGGAGTSGGSGPRAPWEQQWDDLVSAAKKEGTVSVLTLVGVGYRAALDEFQRAFGITVEQQAAPSATVWLPKMQQERAANIYSLDVAVVPPNSALINMRPQGGWDPIRPVIFRPDVLDEAAWTNGFNGRFMDADRSLAFGWELFVQHIVGYNTDLVKPGEVTGIKDLLDPKWRGQLIVSDPRVGDGFLSMSNLREKLGDDAVRRLLVEQQPQLSRDPRALAEAVIRGKNPVGLGMRVVVLKEFADQGLTRSLKVIDVPELDFAPITSIFLVNRAPHPNAARLFINWFLTKEGQTAFAKNLPTNSARTDVEIAVREAAATSGNSYYEAGNEKNYVWVTDTQKFINQMTGITD